MIKEQGAIGIKDSAVEIQYVNGCIFYFNPPNTLQGYSMLNIADTSDRKKVPYEKGML